MKIRAVTLSVLATLSMTVQAPPLAEAKSRQPRWTTLAPAPTPRTEAVATARGKEIYLIGGFVPGGTTVSLVEIYDTRTDSWRLGPPLPIPVNHAYAATVKDTVYVFGGYLGPAFGGALQPLSLPTDKAFALRDGRWEPIAPLPSGRGAGSAAVIGQDVYLVGGVDEESLAKQTLVYDTRRDEWSAVDGLPIARQHLGVASLNGEIYAVGGRIDLLTSNLGLADRFDPGTGRWKDLPSLPTPRGGLGAAGTTNGFMVAIGGEHQGGVFGDVEAFDVDRGKWIDLPMLPTPRHGLGVAAIGTKVYALVGGTEAGYSYSTSNEMIDL